MRCSRSPSSAIATPAAAPVERHRLGLVAQVHPAADPVAAGVDVLPALGRADPAQLGVDHRAVVALLVVLDDDLPVGRHLVLVRAVVTDEPLRAVRRDDVLERAEVVGERTGRDRTGSTNTQPCHSRTGTGDEPELAGVEPCDVAEARGRPQRCRRGGRSTRGRGRRCCCGRRRPPQGSSSCPRCRQALANPRSTPSSSAGQQHAPSPAATARRAPGSARSSARPRQTSRRRCAAAPRRAPARRRTRRAAASGCRRTAPARARAAPGSRGTVSEHEHRVVH